MPFPILYRLANRILIIERKGDKLVFTEACDLYFEAELSADEVRQLARELTELADNAQLVPPEYRS